MRVVAKRLRDFIILLSMKVKWDCHGGRVRFLSTQMLYGHGIGGDCPIDLIPQSVQVLIKIENIHFSQGCITFIQKNSANSGPKI